MLAPGISTRISVINSKDNKESTIIILQVLSLFNYSYQYNSRYVGSHTNAEYTHCYVLNGNGLFHPSSSSSSSFFLAQHFEIFP